jgi:competence protein ComEC
MLIDGGGFSSTTFDSGKDIIAPFLWHRKITRIDYLVLSHPQRDHMKGLRFIAENFSPKELWWGGAGRISKELRLVLEEKRIKVKGLDSRSPAQVIAGVKLGFLAPPVFTEGAVLDVNDSSLVLRLEYGKRRFLFTGDVAEAGEVSLMSNYDIDELRADVLKAPHHGSRYSSSRGFLRRVAPKVVVISSGRGNSFGFPYVQTLERYREQGVDIYRTDSGGAIFVTTDGTSLDITSHLTAR